MPHGVAAADIGHPLADAVLAVEREAGADFGDHAAIGPRVHFTGQQLVDIKGQELDAVRIHAAQIGGNQTGGGDCGLVRRHARGFQYALAEGREVSDRNNGHEVSG